jgi:hypothetical protein
MRKARLASIAFACGLAAVAAQGETLQVAEPPVARSSIEAPARGMSMAQVEARFGAPAERYAAVGQPPITRWVYPAFVVYFEYSHVVHAVTRSPGAPAP